MSKSEDYLDQLLHDMSGNGEAAEKKSDFDDVGLFSEETGRISRENPKEDAFLSEFEREFLGDGETDDFLREFEQEMRTVSSGKNSENQSLLDDLDEIVDSAKKQMQGRLDSHTEDDMMVDTMNPEESDADNEIRDQIAERLDSMTSEPESVGSFEEPELGMDIDSSNDLPSEEPDLLDGFETDHDFADLDSLQEKSEDSFSDNIGLSDDVDDILNSLNIEEEEENGKKKNKKKKREKKEKKDTNKEGKSGGFLAKLSLILFGPDEEEEKQKKAGENQTAGEGKKEELSAEELLLFEQLNGGSSVPVSEKAVPEEKPKKEKKKKEKKEKPKKEKNKKEKPKKVKKPKPKKEKKPKPPKEPDNTPPLPKVPVILIFVMAVSLLALVLLGTNYIGYSNDLLNAEKAYAKQNYGDAFEQIAGAKIKEKDQSTYDQYRIMAIVSGGYEAYEGLMDGGIYDMALDSLVRSIGRCEKYREDARNYGCEDELNQLESNVETLLFSVFGVTKEEALELYSCEDRKEYSTALYQILEKSGFEKVTE